MLNTVGDYRAVALAEHLLNQGIRARRLPSSRTSTVPPLTEDEGLGAHWNASPGDRYEHSLDISCVEIRRGVCTVRPLPTEHEVQVLADLVVPVTQNESRRELYEQLIGDFLKITLA